MTLMCAWCSHLLGQSPPWELDYVSHGMCILCARDLAEEMEAAAVAHGEATSADEAIELVMS